MQAISNRGKILILLLVACCCSVSLAAVQAADQPTEIHLTWDQNDTAHTMVVTWTTQGEGAGDSVWFDTLSHQGNLTEYPNNTTGTHHASPDTDGYIHVTELVNLTPNTTYYFTCGGANGGVSAERKFLTAPDAPTNITFVVGGDSRTNPELRDVVSKEMATFNPSFVVYTGDAVDDGKDGAQWDDWFAAIDKYWVTEKDNLTIPIIPVLGNHEKNASQYYSQYSLPGNERWFSLDYGPDLHLIVLDTSGDMAGVERDWLEQDLAAHNNSTWKLVFFHAPAFSGGGEHGSTPEVQKDWVPLFDKYQVDLVVNSHDHDYERTYPINLSVSEKSPVSGSNHGTTYVVSGGWGAPLYEGHAGWWSAKGPESITHFTLVDLEESGSLRLKAIDKNGNIFDEVQIPKSDPAP
ncbi:MAG TPA: metallophosphoesterase family protein [Methanomicrobiales archaeon]|nr:metallophosphoesterase family protein [Methanomicrobiales archaeon]